ETAAICTPPTPLSFKLPGPGFTPCAVIGSAPIAAHACFQLIGDGPPTIFPPCALNFPGSALSVGATFANSIASASTAARLVADPIPPTVPLPPEPADEESELLPTCTSMSDTPRPSVSAAMIAITV